MNNLPNTEDKLFSKFGHDLRGAFVSILGYTELLKDPDEKITGPAGHSVRASTMVQRRKSLQDVEREQVEDALVRNGWVQARAARELGLTQRQIGYRMKKFHLQRPEFP